MKCVGDLVMVKNFWQDKRILLFFSCHNNNNNNHNMRWQYHAGCRRPLNVAKKNNLICLIYNSTKQSKEWKLNTYFDFFLLYFPSTWTNNHFSLNFPLSVAIVQNLVQSNQNICSKLRQNHGENYKFKFQINCVSLNKPKNVEVGILRLDFLIKLNCRKRCMEIKKPLSFVWKMGRRGGP